MSFVRGGPAPAPAAAPGRGRRLEEPGELPWPRPALGRGCPGRFPWDLPPHLLLHLPGPPRSRGQHRESEPGGRRATNPDFIVKERRGGRGGAGVATSSSVRVGGDGKASGARPPPGRLLAGLTTRKPRRRGGHAPPELCSSGCLVGGQPRGLGAGTGEATDSANPAERAGAGARLLLLFAHSFAEGEAGVGLDWTPLAPLGTPWAMGAGEKNGIQTGWGGGGEGGACGGIYLVPPKCRRCPRAAPRPRGLGRARCAGHSEVAGGNTQVLWRDPGPRLLPSPCGGRGCSRKRFSLGAGGRSPRVRLLPGKSISAPRTPTMACEPRFVLGLGGKG